MLGWPTDQHSFAMHGKLLRRSRIMKNCFLLMVFVLLSLPTFAQQCDPTRAETTPDHLFIMNEDGTVKDKKTKLLWMRCALGQIWRDGSCTSSYLTYDFFEARVAVRELNREGGFAGYQEWRLPTVEELSTIVERRCYDPAINLKAFPNAPVTGYWSSTQDPGYRKGALLVHLLTGYSYMGNKRIAWALRLVRNDK